MDSSSESASEYKSDALSLPQPQSPDHVPLTTLKGRFSRSRSPSPDRSSPVHHLAYIETNRPSAYTIPSFKTSSTRRQSLLRAPVELQKRIILNKLRVAKTRGHDERWEAQASAEIVKGKKLAAKRERVAAEKKRKEKAAKEKAKDRERKRREEAEMQLRNFSLKRHAREGAKRRVADGLFKKYNEDAAAFIKAKKEFKAEMRRRKDEKKQRQDEQKSTLKGQFTAKVEGLKVKEQVKQRRETNLGIKLQNVSGMTSKEAKEQAQRVLKMREDASAKKKLIADQKAALQNKRKLAWQEQLMRNGMLEALMNKRNKAIEAKEEEVRSECACILLSSVPYPPAAVGEGEEPGGNQPLHLHEPPRRRPLPIQAAVPAPPPRL